VPIARNHSILRSTHQVSQSVQKEQVLASRNRNGSDICSRYNISKSRVSDKTRRSAESTETAVGTQRWLTQIRMVADSHHDVDMLLRRPRASGGKRMHMKINEGMCRRGQVTHQCCYSVIDSLSLSCTSDQVRMSA
jgi:hypothetical protein